MECLHCKGNMTKSKAPFSVDRNGYHISWEAVPAWVCTQCGDPYFEAAEIHHIQNALEKIDYETQLLTPKMA